MMPLTIADVGEPVRVVRVGGREDTHRHLEEMGLVPDSEVMIVSKVGKNMILQVRDSRVALDGGLANKIMVEESTLRTSSILAPAH